MPKKTGTKKIARVAMPEQDPNIRRRNFEEVPLGYTVEMAMEEASRCIQCRKPSCVTGCPVQVDIPGFINLITQGDFTGSIRHLWTQNALPAVCGRVCPQESQCEGVCILGKKGNQWPSVTLNGLWPTTNGCTEPASCHPNRNQRARRWRWWVPARRG